MGFSSPLTSYSPTDHQPAVWVVSFLVAIYSVGLLVARYSLRRKFGRSDQVLTAAYVLGLVSWCLIWAALSQGLAKSTSVLSDQDYASTSRLVYASTLILFLAQACTIASQCLFIGEYATNYTTTCAITSVVASVLSIGALISVTAGCSSSRYLETGATSCPNQDTRWIAAAILLSIGSCVPSALAFHCFSKVQTRLTRKVNVYIAFSSSVLNIPVLAGIAITARTYFNDGESSLDSPPWIICLQVFLFLSYLGTTMPCVRPLALKFTTAGLVIVDDSQLGTQTMRSTTRSTNANNKRISEIKPLQLRNDVEFSAFQHEITATGGDSGRSQSVNSFGSQSQFIRKTVETGITVERVEEDKTRTSEE